MGSLTRSGLLKIASVAILVGAGFFYLLYNLGAFSSISQLFYWAAAAVVGIIILLAMAIAVVKSSKNEPPAIAPSYCRNPAEPSPIVVLFCYGYVGLVTIVGLGCLFYGIVKRDKITAGLGCIVLTIGGGLIWASFACQKK